MIKTSDLIRKALQTDSQSFLHLIKQVNWILTNEEQNPGKLRLTGRLVMMPKFGEAIVLGDIHGDLNSLEHILNETEFFKKASKVNDIFMIFLGDYGDRGLYSPEVYYVVLSLKNMFPEKIVLLQGNHEGPKDLMAHPHDLPIHLQRKFGRDWQTVYDRLSQLYRRFYTAVLVNREIILLHGGVPSKAKNLDDVAYAYDKHPVESHLEEMLWSDPSDYINGVYPSPRGAGYLFGQDMTKTFLKMFTGNIIIRGHEPSVEGYKINHNGMVLTLFSRKGLPYYNRHGAYITLDLAKSFSSALQLKLLIHKF